MTSIAQGPKRNAGWVVPQRWAWLLLPLACHLGFSWIGFNPTDDGWMEAVARRIINGEIPHRDFIYVRPALSALLQVPVVWLGGEHTIWFSRLWGWLTVGGIGWIWSGFAEERPVPFGIRYLQYGIIFLLTAHVFPVMAWHTLDGMLIASLAVGLAQRGTTAGIRSAFLLAGLAALCRQNFALFVPFLFVAIPGRRPWGAALWAAIPPAAYLAAAAIAGCLGDFIRQEMALSGAFVSVAIFHIVGNWQFLAALAAGAALNAAIGWARRGNPAAADWIARLATLATAAIAARSLWNGPDSFPQGSFALFGAACGLALTAGITGRAIAAGERLPVVAGVGLIWVTAISLGYNSPAFASGIAWLLIWRLLRPKVLHTGEGFGPRAASFVALASLLMIAVAFDRARLQFPYLDRPASELLYDVGQVLPGGAGIRTNERTYAALADLHSEIGRCAKDHRPYVLLTDFSCAWIRSAQPNPLPCEWPQSSELGNSPELAARVIKSLEELSPDSRIVVQRYITSALSAGIHEMPSGAPFYFVQDWTRKNCRMIAQTRFFDIYLPPVRVHAALIAAHRNGA
jgi:hypothetical protein